MKKHIKINHLILSGGIASLFIIMLIFLLAMRIILGSGPRNIPWNNSPEIMSHYSDHHRIVLAPFQASQLQLIIPPLSSGV